MKFYYQPVTTELLMNQIEFIRSGMFKIYRGKNFKNDKMIINKIMIKYTEKEFLKQHFDIVRQAIKEISALDRWNEVEIKQYHVKG